MRQTSFASMQCSIARSLELIGDWWTPLIVRDLYYGLSRFDDLVQDLGISRNLLTARLTHLVKHGIVSRRRYSQRPSRHEYLLTEAGRDLMPVLLALMAWGDRWATPDGGPPVLFEHQPCGHRSTPVVSCDTCGEPVRPGEFNALPGPGARPSPGTQLVAAMLSARRTLLKKVP
ncbi:winged helix-turn-helix transcriptional regulator [Kribbella sp. NPDC004536]|uniref:winged helix-turn-helix transcriptional regulator n=1 Tax=Kribbella sp. NPDC004536 TaxID=3364106 RepID=UPI0036AA2E9D